MTDSDGRNLFGGSWTEWKLEAVEDYIRAYLAITRGKRLELWYVDVFAGSGSRFDPATGDADLANATLLPDLTAMKVYEGSAHLALHHSFDRFLLAEKDPDKARRLQALAEEHGRRDQVEIVTGDGLEALMRWCAEVAKRPHARAVVFLDPFAMAVEWTSMERLAATRKVDVWILFPLAAIVRNLPKKGRTAISPSHQAKLDRVFGCSTWVDAFYEEGPVETSLFDEPRSSVVRFADPVDIVRFYQGRLATIFAGGVAPGVRWLCNSQQTPIFALLFAMANPDQRAHRLGLKVANHILRKTR